MTEYERLEKVYRELRQLAISLDVAIIINGRIYGTLPKVHWSNQENTNAKIHCSHPRNYH